MDIRPTGKEVETACLQALNKIGMPKKYGFARTCLNPDFDCAIGLNQGVYQDYVRVNPNLFIYWKALEALMVQFYGESSRTLGPSYSDALGVSCPEIPQFIFSVREDLVIESARLAQAVQEFGIPYISAFASPDKLMPQILKSVPRKGGMQHRYPLGLYLSKGRATALEYCEQQCQEFKARNAVVDAEAMMRLISFLHQQP